MWSGRTTKLLDLYGGTTRRRGAKLGLIVALLAVLPGLVAGTTYISSASQTPQFAGSQSGISSASCVWFGTNDTDTGSGHGNGVFVVVGSLGTSAVTITLDEYTSVSWQYMVGELALACTATPTGRVTTVALSASQTAVDTASAAWTAVEMQGGITSGSGSSCAVGSVATGYYTSGACTGGTCSVTAPCYPFKDGDNPGTYGVAAPTAGSQERYCDQAGGGLGYPDDGVAYSATPGETLVPNLFTWSMNQTALSPFGAWTTDACNQGHAAAGAAPPTLTVAAGLTSGATAYYWASFAFISTASSVTSVTLTLTATVVST